MDKIVISEQVQNLLSINNAAEDEDEDDINEIEIKSEVMDCPSVNLLDSNLKMEKSRTRPNSRPVSQYTREKPTSIPPRPVTASAISKMSSNSQEKSLNVHKLGQTPTYLKKLRMDPDSDLIKKFNSLKTKLGDEKLNLRMSQQKFKKIFNECKEISMKIPDRVVFDETLDCLDISPDSMNSRESLDQLKTDYMGVAQSFMEDLKSSLQEGGDHKLDFSLLENQILESFKKKIDNVDQELKEKFKNSKKIEFIDPEVVKEKETQIVQLQKEFQEIKDKFRKEEKRNLEYCNKNADLSKHMKVQKEKLEEAETEVEKLRKLLKERDLEIKDLKLKARKALENEKQMQQILDEYELLKQENQKVEDELRKEISKSQGRSDDEFQEICQKVQNLEDQLSLKCDELQKISKEKEKLEQTQIYQENEIKSLRNSLENSQQDREKLIVLYRDLDERAEECFRLREKVSALEEAAKNSSSTVKTVQYYEDLMKKFKANETELVKRIDDLRRNVENEAFERTSNEGIMMLRGALIGALQEKEYTYKHHIELLEVKLKESQRQNSILKSKIDHMTKSLGK